MLACESTDWIKLLLRSKVHRERSSRWLFVQRQCDSGSVGGVRPCQGRGRGFESRLSLLKKRRLIRTFSFLAVPKGLRVQRHDTSYHAGPFSGDWEVASGRRKPDVHRTSCAPSVAVEEESPSDFRTGEIIRLGFPRDPAGDERSEVNASVEARLLGESRLTLFTTF